MWMQMMRHGSKFSQIKSITNGPEFAYFFLAKEQFAHKKSESLPLLFGHEQPEPHGCSFVMSDLSKSLMVTLL